MQCTFYARTLNACRKGAMNAENMQITLCDSLIFLRRIATEIITAHLFVPGECVEDETGSSYTCIL
jgi:hypothetical protein